MKSRYHREITIKALGAYFNSEGLEMVVSANLGQDALRFQVGHDHFHYDSNSFAAADAYCSDLRLSVLAALKRADVPAARQAFGCLTHAVQDFYAHSNYVTLWREIHPGASPDEIEPELSSVLSHSHLHSGKLYYPLEIFSFINALKPYILRFLPHDSHAWMNMDDPSRANFEFAFSAAVKRTVVEYQRLVAMLPQDQIALLRGIEA